MISTVILLSAVALYALTELLFYMERRCAHAPATGHNPAARFRTQTRFTTQLLVVGAPIVAAVAQEMQSLNRVMLSEMFLGTIFWVVAAHIIRYPLRRGQKYVDFLMQQERRRVFALRFTAIFFALLSVTIIITAHAV